MTVRYTDAAEDDLRAIIAEQCRVEQPDPDALANRLKLRIAVLALFPDSGYLVPETGAREWTLHGTPYVVLYVSHTTGIDILRVLGRNR